MFEWLRRPAQKRQLRRVAVVDIAPVDNSRTLVLIRRDNVEHLVMIGGRTDIVIERNALRGTGAHNVARPASPGPARLAPESFNRPPAVAVAPLPDVTSSASAQIPSPPQSPQTGQALFELTRQLESALSLSPAPQNRSRVTDAFAVPPSATGPRADAPVPEFASGRKLGLQAEPNRETRIEPKSEALERGVEPELKSLPDVEQLEQPPSEPSAKGNAADPGK